MQTFLPYKRFDHSARVLDNKRLGKQRVETMQIMKALVLNEGWIHHPVTKMWRGYEMTLFAYQEAICDQWSIKRKFNDTCLEKTRALLEGREDTALALNAYDHGADLILPPWLGLKKFHSPHRANLLRKDPIHYGRFGWKELPDEGYWYPPEGFTLSNKES